jgi:hypothetical protein
MERGHQYTTNRKDKSKETAILFKTEWVPKESFWFNVSKAAKDKWVMH